MPWRALLGQAMALPDGPSRLAVLEEAVRIADTHGDTHAGFEMRRNHLMWSAILSGQPGKMIAAFTWCLSHCDRDPDKFPVDEVLWNYCNWVPVALHLSPMVPRTQLESVFDDLFERLQRAGWSLRSALEQRALATASLGDLKRAAAFWAQRCRLPRDPRQSERGSRGNEVTYHLLRGDEDAALDAAQLFLSNRLKGSDAEFAHLLMPLVRRDRLSDAMSCHLKEYRLIAKTVLYLGEIGKHMEFLALTDNLDAAVTLLERHAAWRWQTYEYIDRFNFQVAARFVLERVQQQGPERRKLRLPKEMPIWRADGDYLLSDLIAWFDAEATEIAGLYDARAGNDYFTRTELDAERALHQLVRPHPIPAAPPAGWGKNSK